MRGNLNLIRLVTAAFVAAGGILGVLTLGATQPREVVIGVLYPLPKWSERK